MNWRVQPVAIALAIILAPASLMMQCPGLKAQPSDSEDPRRQKPAPFVLPEPPPDLGAPTGRRRGAASRLGCPLAALDLTALVTNQNWDLTFAEYPTFWFYIPNGLPASVQIEEFEGEFVVEGRNYQNVYRIDMMLPATSGVTSISLPASPQYSLENNQPYRWYFRIFCDPQDPSVYVFVDGIVIRVTRDAYSSENALFDILTDLASRRRLDPQDVELNQDWANLLRLIGLEELANEPLLPPLKPTELSPAE